MLKKTITYKNFDDEEKTGTYYFNLSKAELAEMAVSVEGGLGERIARIIQAKDNKSILEEFKSFILLAYGVRSEDGERFIKNDQIREEFASTAAFHKLYEEMLLDDDVAANFIKGCIPKDLIPEFDKAIASTPSLPPPTA